MHHPMKKFRDSRGLSQELLARQLDVSARMITRVESGLRGGLNLRERLRLVFGLDWLEIEKLCRRRK